MNSNIVHFTSKLQLPYDLRPEDIRDLCLSFSVTHSVTCCRDVLSISGGTTLVIYILWLFDQREISDFWLSLCYRTLTRTWTSYLNLFWLPTMPSTTSVCTGPCSHSRWDRSLKTEPPVDEFDATIAHILAAEATGNQERAEVFVFVMFCCSLFWFIELPMYRTATVKNTVRFKRRRLMTYRYVFLVWCHLLSLGKSNRNFTYMPIAFAKHNIVLFQRHLLCTSRCPLQYP